MIDSLTPCFLTAFAKLCHNLPAFSLISFNNGLKSIDGRKGITSSPGASSAFSASFPAPDAIVAGTLSTPNRPGPPTVPPPAKRGIIPPLDLSTPAPRTKDDASVTARVIS